MKNMKLFWRMSGFFLISALFFAFGGGSLRAQTYEFVKITSLDDLNGAECLIVYESSATAGVYADNYASSKYAGVTVDISNGTITPADGMCTFTFTANETNWDIKDNKQNANIIYNSGTNFKTGTGDTWTITKEDDGFKIVSTKTTGRAILWSTPNTKFAPYATSNLGSDYHLVQLYKKQEAAATCDPVTDAKAQAGSTSVTLTWDGPTTEPENGYIVNISAGETAVVTDAVVAKSTHTYTHSSLTAGTEYSYSIVSACSETSKSTAVTGTFTTKEAATKSLHVTLSGTKESSSYLAGNITFNFSVENATLGSDAQVKCYIIGEDDEEVEKTTAEASYTHSFTTPGTYEAEFELVDMSGASFEPTVKEEIEFTVKLPKVAAPTFTPAEQAAAFTTAQTVTLASTTEGATVYYAIGEADFAEYATGIDLNATGTYIIKAYAAKTGMANSDTLTKTYKLDLPETLANLKAVYAKDKNAKVLVSGKMVVTNKDSYNNRIWVQDIVKENGASMLLFNASNGYDAINVGDVLENVAGTVDIYNGLYELKPSVQLTAVETGHSVYVDTLTADYINNNIATVQSALVCVEDVTFASTGNFATNTKYILQQGEKELNFYTTFNSADYIGQAISTARLNVVGILSVNTAKPEGTYIVARNAADMEEILVCEDVQTVHSEIEGTTAHFSWEVDHEPALGYIIEVRTDNEANTLIKRDTVNNPKTLTYNLEGLAEGAYTCYVMAYCGEDNVAEAVTDHFSIVAAGAPSIAFVKPSSGELTRDSVMFTCKVTNFVLGTGEGADGSIKYTITGTNLAAPVTATITDTFFFYKFDRSGKDTVRIELVDKDGASLNPAKVARRYFSINLPDVAQPVIMPEATTAKEAIEVTMSCDTEDATIYYSLNGADYVAYTGAIKCDTTGTYAFRAYAAKAKMDTSKVTSKTYTLKIPKPLEPGVVFYEPFDRLEDAGIGALDTKLDDYTTLPGWTGERVYMQVAGIAKMGAGSANGYLQTPVITALTEGATYLLSFDAQAWNKDSDKLTLTIGETEYEISGLVNDENVGTNGTPTQMKTFEKEFTATAATTIRFTSNGTVGKSRFFLDNVKVQEATEDPAFNVVSSLTISTTQGTPVSQKVTVTGRNLTDDIAVTCTGENITVAPATLAKADVMSENGAELTVTFDGSVATASATITLAHGDLSKTIEVSATATTAQEVDNLAALREKDADESTVYKVKGEVVVTAVDGVSVWAQDATAAILIYGATGQEYQVGDGITGIYGTLKNYNDLIELLPGGNQPAAGSHDNVVEPEVMTVKELNEAGAENSSRLVRINGVALSEAEGVWVGSTNYKVADEEGNELAIRTTVSHGSYIGEALPTGKFDLIAVVGIYNGTVQVSPRVKEDIIAGEVDPCDAPTNLKAVVADKSVTLTWNGAAEQYRVVVTLGEKEVCNELVSEKTYALNNLEVGTYAWKVASVCEGGEEWANGDAFEVKPVANEAAEGLAFRIYPNPTTGVFYVEVAEGARMEIFTLGGVMVRNEMLKAGRNEVRLDRSGIYFVRLTNANGAAVQRVIVR